jgi:tol-pal system protein YbgF
MSPFRHRVAAAALAAFLLSPLAVQAQDRNNGFLDNLFSRGEREPRAPADAGRVAQADPADLTVRLDSLENAMRKLTGTLEQLQYQNQQLQMQLRRMQDDTELRFQQLGSKGAAPGLNAPSAPLNAPLNAPPNTGRRGDLFDPSQQPNAPGAPRPLGGVAAIAQPEANEPPPVGVPGGRPAGAPLDLTTMSSNASLQQQMPPPMQPPIQSALPQALPPSAATPPRPAAVQPPVQQLATLPPKATAQDEYDMAYGYMLHKDYELADQAFRDFMRKYPNERLLPDAQYWLGESMFQRQLYRDAAESFLAVSTKYEGAGKAPDSLLRLGQSLAALKQKEAACATLAEVEHKYPRASASVKRGVAAEQKRVHC